MRSEAGKRTIIWIVMKNLRNKTSQHLPAWHWMPQSGGRCTSQITCMNVWNTPQADASAWYMGRELGSNFVVAEAVSLATSPDLITGVLAWTSVAAPLL